MQNLFVTYWARFAHFFKHPQGGKHVAEVFVAEAAEKAWETNKKLTKESLVLAGQAKTILARFKENVNHSILGDKAFHAVKTAIIFNRVLLWVVGLSEFMLWFITSFIFLAPKNAEPGQEIFIYAVGLSIAAGFTMGSIIGFKSFFEKILKPLDLNDTPERAKQRNILELVFWGTALFGIAFAIFGFTQLRVMDLEGVDGNNAIASAQMFGPALMILPLTLSVIAGLKFREQMNLIDAYRWSLLYRKLQNQLRDIMVRIGQIQESEKRNLSDITSGYWRTFVHFMVHKEVKDGQMADYLENHFAASSEAFHQESVAQYKRMAGERKEVEDILDQITKVIDNNGSESGESVPEKNHETPEKKAFEPVNRGPLPNKNGKVSVSSVKINTQSGEPIHD